MPSGRKGIYQAKRFKCCSRSAPSIIAGKSPFFGWDTSAAEDIYNKNCIDFLGSLKNPINAQEKRYIDVMMRECKQLSDVRVRVLKAFDIATATELKEMKKN